MAISVNFTKLTDLEGVFKMNVTDGREAYMTHTDDGKIVIYIPSQTRQDKSVELKSDSWILGEVRIDEMPYQANMYSRLAALMMIEEAVGKALNIDKPQPFFCLCNLDRYDAAPALEEMVEEIAQYVRDNYKYGEKYEECDNSEDDNEVKPGWGEDGENETDEW